MACRIRNAGKHLLRVDLRDGETLFLRPGETSPALREERLYGNVYLAQWEAQGILVRRPASMREVIEREKAAAGAPAEPQAEAPEPREAAPGGRSATESVRAEERPAKGRPRRDR